MVKLYKMNQSLYNRLYDFFMISLGLLIESMPFVIIGVFISSIIAVFVKSSKILEWKSKNRLISHIQAMFIGVFLPVCECGNIPLAKRLSMIGFKPSEVITFMLAAPILNPLVLLTTLEAFNLDRNIGIIRVVGGGFIALTVGLMFSYHPNSDELMFPINKNLRKFGGFKQAVTNENVSKNSLSSNIASTSSIGDNDSHNSQFVEVFREEFFAVFKVLVLGCVLAGLFQTLIPREFIQFFSSDPTLSIIALMALAFVISICSSVDAFFALSLASTFSLGSIISFLAFGPMIDIKTLTMLKSVFKTKTLVTMTAIVAMLCFILGMSVNTFYKIFY